MPMKDGPFLGVYAAVVAVPEDVWAELLLSIGYALLSDSSATRARLHQALVKVEEQMKGR